MLIDVNRAAAVHPSDAACFSRMGVADHAIGGQPDDAQQAVSSAYFFECTAQCLLEVGPVEHAGGYPSAQVQIEDLFPEASRRQAHDRARVIPGRGRGVAESADRFVSAAAS